MKKLLSFFLTICFFISCNNNNKGLRGINERDDDNNKNNTGSNWTKKNRSNWLDQCIDQVGATNPQAKKICSCVLGKLEKKYPDYNEMEEKGTEADGEKMARECMAELTGTGGNDDYENNDDNNRRGDDDEEEEDEDNYNNNEDNNGSRGWSKTDRNKFLNDCVNSVGGYQGNARQLCTCVLEKLQKKYSSLADADRRGVEAAKRFSQECMGGDMGDDGSGDDYYDNN